MHALGAEMGGALRHLTGFLPELGKVDNKNEYLVLVKQQFPDLKLSENIQLERVKDDTTKSSLSRVIFDIYELPMKLRRERFDAVVSLTNFGPVWSPVPHILFQRNALYYYPYYLSKIHGRQKIEILLRKKLAVSSMKRADIIVAPSNAMVDMIKTACPEVADRKFHTIYHGYSRKTINKPLDKKYESLISMAGEHKFLYPTHLAPWKGFEILFDILKKLKDQSLQFKLFTTISRNDWPEGVIKYENRIVELDLQDNVVLLGKVPQHQMGMLYQACDLMIYPSLCESFGFSMLEAINYRMPIVAAGTAVNQEICGKAAMFYSPLDADEGANVIQEAIRPENIEVLGIESQKRVQSFDWSWKRYATEFVDMVELVI